MPRHAPGPIPTLAGLRRSTYWVWLYCNACPHSTPTALAPWIIRWGADASSDRLRRSARCAQCGAIGASLMMPSWGDLATGPAPFPVERMPLK